MKDSLFRKSALQQLSAPEQLDQLMQVTSRRGWIALSGLMLALAATLFWSVFGSIPTRIAGQGILLKRGGVHVVVAQGAGVISHLEPLKPGDRLMEGQIIVSIAQPVASSQRDAAKVNLAELEQEESVMAQAVEHNLELSRQHFKQREKAIALGKEAKGELVQSLQLTLQGQEALLRDGIITRQSYENSRQALFQARQDIQNYDAQLKQLAHEHNVAETNSRQQLIGIHERVQNARGQLRQNDANLTLTSTVVSPYEGRVIEIKATEGSAVNAMSPIIDVEDETSELEAEIYLPPLGEAKNVRVGMEVQLSPDTAKRQEFGFIVGRVESVSLFPATREGMLAILHRDRVVDSLLSKQGPPVAVRVSLLKNPSTRSGLQWSSRAGSKVEVSGGTLCTAQIKLRERPPITLVMPWLKHLFGLE
ncbi:NHLP bacteriocin system secretion protein [Candidatus Methylospira mobilis]|uniref:NHLP bacteriocin system secretion protein n=1 Tax=Candidatus Methylospira mobilis TaxID=1808979 RepID=UPI0028E46F09|nr:NHLP bacteriocin system secretion protein [Candidatus Methylospira mobilis]WNV03566.1 NHLP bacteriocin system secretion protein [Candidatus Methylospira mobilis]